MNKNIFKKNSIILFNNKLYYINHKYQNIRLKQKLPEFINNINELKKYDINFKKKK